jgi:hypothetical protein
MSKCFGWRRRISSAITKVSKKVFSPPYAHSAAAATVTISLRKVRVATHLNGVVEANAMEELHARGRLVVRQVLVRSGTVRCERVAAVALPHAQRLPELVTRVGDVDGLILHSHVELLAVNLAACESAHASRSLRVAATRPFA